MLCCDDSGTNVRTNVAQIYRSIEPDERVAHAHYSAYGLTSPFMLPAIRARLRTQEVYRFLVDTFEPGDRVFLFGAGRGGFLVRVLVSMVSACGVVRREHAGRIGDVYNVFDRPEAVDFRRQYAHECIPDFIGMFDATVPWLASSHVDWSIPGAVRSVYHAASLDDDFAFRLPLLLREDRRPPSQIVEQVWFSGRHPDVIGSARLKGLSDCALKWMLDRAAWNGLPLRADWAVDVHPRPTEAMSGGYLAVRVLLGRRSRRVPVGSLVHESVTQRLAEVPDYRPRNLPEARVVVPWNVSQSADTPRDDDAELDAIRQELKVRPDDLQLWQRLADRLRPLNRFEEFEEAVRRVNKLREARAFDVNASQEVRVAHLDVRDLDFFGSFHWTLTPHVNVLLGKNGYGKSHLLTLMVAMLQNARDYANGFVPDRSRPTATVDLQATRNGKPLRVGFTKLGFEANGLGKVPVLAISELRFIDKSRSDFGKEDIGEEDLKINGADRFLQRRPLGPIVQEFIYRVCQESDRKHTLDLPIIHLYEEVVRKLTSTEFEIVGIAPVRNSARYRVEVLTEGNDVPVILQQASQGTLSVMAMVGLIYDFLLQLYPEDKEDARRVRPGIVFIDELDAHLHPSWQRKILGLLRSTFPNIQFIVAAHSPLVVAGCKRGEVTVLRRPAQGVGFLVEQLDRHFVGTSTAELYSLLFELEEKDDTYLHYAAMFPFRADILREAKALEARVALPPKEQQEYLGLLDRRNTLAHLLTVGQRLLQKTERERDVPVWREIVREAHLQQVDQMRVTSSMLEERLSLSPDQMSRLEALEKRQHLPPDEQKRLDQLREDLYYLAEYERIETIRANQREQATQERMDLEDSLFSSTGQET